MIKSLLCTLALVALCGPARAELVERATMSRADVLPGGDPTARSDGHAPLEARLEVEMQSLLNWATFLSGYDLEVAVPEIRFEAREFFVDNACGGRDACRVIGWYDDGNIIYIDRRLRNLDSLFERSLMVHELVHHLQHVSGRYPEKDCASYVTREREAYAVQQQFFVAYGAMPGIQTHYFSCHKLDSGEVVLAHGP